MAKKISSVQQLKKLAKENALDCFIALCGGALRSSKNVYWASGDKYFSVINEIDDSEQILSEQELFTQSNIGEAIKNGCFFAY